MSQRVPLPPPTVVDAPHAGGQDFVSAVHVGGHEGTTSCSFPTSIAHENGHFERLLGWHGPCSTAFCRLIGHEEMPPC
jgi:hypothetical protein